LWTGFGINGARVEGLVTGGDLVDSRIICIAWFKPENYLPLKVLFEDGDALHDTFFEWEKSANGLVRKATQEGLQVIHVDIDPVEFPKWCAARGLKLVAASRSRYASEIGRRSMDTVG
jgi:hypothetical protein